MDKRTHVNIHLAYWSDDFTILSSRLIPKKYCGLHVWLIHLHCRGQRIGAVIHELRLPSGWTPKSGQRVSAKLRTSNHPGVLRLHVQAIKPL
jgi:hypothetical protein